MNLPDSPKSRDHSSDAIDRAQFARVAYPYSVIPGGVRNRAELVGAIIREPVVAEHFSGFNAAGARIDTLRDEEFVHVSFRIRNKIFWTAKKVRLAPGEEVITDGHTAARTRCGNRIAPEPQEPISPEEPAAIAFETPIVFPEPDYTIDLELLELTEFPLVRPLEVPQLTYLPPRPLVHEWKHTPRRHSILPPHFMTAPPLTQPAVVPEPGTLLLLASGMAALVLYWSIRKI
jgi:hypothetical protein